MLSVGMLFCRAVSTAVRRRGLAFTSPPPRRAATVISLMNFVNSFPRRASFRAFLCLIELHARYELTAAHPSLPLGTRVMVTDLANGRSVEVRINDRGPFVDGRAIDLSLAAARVLRMVGPGTVRVRIEVLGTETRVATRSAPLVPPPARDLPASRYLVQVASLSDPGRAEHLRRVLGTRFPDAHVAPLETAESRYYRVVIGPYPLRGAAVARGEMVNRLGYPAVIMEDSAP